MKNKLLKYSLALATIAFLPLTASAAKSACIYFVTGEAEAATGKYVKVFVTYDKLVERDGQYVPSGQTHNSTYKVTQAMKTYTNCWDPTQYSLKYVSWLKNIPSEQKVDRSCMVGDEINPNIYAGGGWVVGRGADLGKKKGNLVECKIRTETIHYDGSYISQ